MFISIVDIAGALVSPLMSAPRLDFLRVVGIVTRNQRKIIWQAARQKKQWLRSPSNTRNDRGLSNQGINRLLQLY